MTDLGELLSWGAHPHARKTVAVIVGSTAGGALFFLGDASSDIMQQISGLVIAILAIISGFVFIKPEAADKEDTSKN